MSLENFIQSIKESVNEHNGPKEGDKIFLKPDFMEEDSDRKGKTGTFVKLTPDSRSMGGNKRGDIAVIKWEDGKTTKEMYYALIKGK